jgi:hypothetical protein
VDGHAIDRLNQSRRVRWPRLDRLGPGVHEFASKYPRRASAVGALIDSSVFMAAERGLCDLEAELTMRLGDWIGMAAITASEMLAGVA